MSLYLIRHARAERRSGFTGADTDRPLNDAGRVQARALIESLDGEPIERILSSPALRCRETVTPLSARRGLPLEIEPRLCEGGSVEDLERLIDELGESDVVLCSHGDLIPALIDRLGLHVDPLRCGKASIWRLDRACGGLKGSYEPPPSVEDESPTRVAVLDLGSTSFHLLVADVGHDGELVRVARKREMLRLGAVLADAEDIPKAAAKVVHKTACSLRDLAWKSGAESLQCVATAAFRDGAQGRRLASELSTQLGVPVTILSGVEEAHANFAAFRRRIGLTGAPELGLDLGGGSLELAVGDSSDVHWETTLALGAVRLHRRHAVGDLDCDTEAVCADVRRTIEPIRSQIRDYAPSRCLATGGTARAVGRLMLRRGVPQQELRGLEITAEQIAELRRDLCAATHDDRLAMPGMTPQRADLLPAGTAVLQTVLEELGQASLVVCDWGLREGVLLTTLRDARRARRAVYSER